MFKGDAGAQELPAEEFGELVERYHASWQDGQRVYAHWACTAPGRERECIRVKVRATFSDRSTSAVL